MSYFNIINSVINTTSNLATQAYNSVNTLSSEHDQLLAKYTVEERVEFHEQSITDKIWVVTQIVNKTTQQPMTLFSYNHPKFPHVKNDPSDNHYELALNAFKRLRALKHPNLLEFKEGVANNQTILMVTERIRPLLKPNETWSFQKGTKGEDLIVLGLWKVAGALQFLNRDAKLVHLLPSLLNIFVNEANIWKLGSFEFVGPYEEITSIKLQQIKVLEMEYHLPESENLEPLKYDTYGFGVLVYQVFNQGVFDPDNLKWDKIPKPLLIFIKKALANQTFDWGKLIQMDYFIKNPLVDIHLFLEEFHIKEVQEQLNYYDKMDQLKLKLDSNYILYKLIPFLAIQLEYAKQNQSKLLNLLLNLGSTLEHDDFVKHVLPTLLHTLKSPQRQLRYLMLSQFQRFKEFLEPNHCEEIFPELTLGLKDEAPPIVESSLRALSLILDKLKSDKIKDDLLPELHQLQFNKIPGLRCNAIVLIARCIPHLSSTVIHLRLLPSLIQSLKDPFPPSRKACVKCLYQSSSQWQLTPMCVQILPALTPLLVDPEKEVRDEALGCVNALLPRIEAEMKELPEHKVEPKPITDTKNDKLIDQNQSATPNGGNYQEDGWTSWAVKSISQTVVSTVATTVDRLQAHALSPTQSEDTTSGEKEPCSSGNANHDSSTLDNLSLKEEHEDPNNNNNNVSLVKEQHSSKTPSRTLKLQSKPRAKLQLKPSTKINHTLLASRDHEPFNIDEADDPWGTSTVEDGTEVLVKSSNQNENKDVGDEESSEWDAWSEDTGTKLTSNKGIIKTASNQKSPRRPNPRPPRGLGARRVG